MKANYVIDLLLVLLALAIVARCWREGFVASLIRLAGTVAAYVSSWLLSAPISLQLYNTFLNPRLLDYAESIIPPELQSFPPELIDAATKFPQVRDQLTGTINAAFADVGFDMGLPVKMVDTSDVGNRLVDTLLESGATVAEAIVEVIMKPAALMVTRVVVFIVIFALVSAVVAILFRIGKVVNRIPLLGGVNRLAGMGVGLLEAAICLYIAAALIFMAAALLRNSDIAFLQSDVLGSSSMLGWIMSWRLPSGFVIFPS